MRERAVGPPERLPPGATDGGLWRPGRPGRGTSRYSPAPYWPTLGEGPSPPPAPQHAHLVHRDPARGAPRRPLSRPRQGAATALPSLPFPAALHLRGASAQQSQGTRGPFPGPSRRGLGFCFLPGVPPSRPLPPRAHPSGAQILPNPHPSFPRVSRHGMPLPQVISRLLAAPSPLLRSLPPTPCPPSPPAPSLSLTPAPGGSWARNSWHLSGQVQKSVTLTSSRGVRERAARWTLRA